MASIRGRRASVYRYAQHRPGTANLRLILVLTLAIGSILGGVYVLGRAASTRDQGSDPHRVATSPGPSRVTTDSPTPTPTAPSPTPSATPSPIPSAAPDGESTPADDRPRLALERDGPYGSRITTGAREVALTFDDGPDPEYTPQVLELLARYRVKATFCLVGQQVSAHPELVRAIVDAGHTLCNHSWSHDVGLGARTRTAIRTDLARTNAAIRAAVPGARIVYFRQPGGAWTSGVVATAWELGMTSLHWTVDPRDWTRPGAGNIASIVTAGVGAGAIVLMHDAGGDRQQTISALRTILPNLLRRFELESLPTGLPRPASADTNHTNAAAGGGGGSARVPDPTARGDERPTAETPPTRTDVPNPPVQ
ncbi:polysaccharide deacetylase family protein [Micromonospora sp. NBC_01699]